VAYTRHLRVVNGNRVVMQCKWNQRSWNFCHTYPARSLAALTFRARGMIEHHNMHTVVVVSSASTRLSSEAASGQALVYLGLALVTMGKILATSLLKAGDCGIADTADGIRAKKRPMKL
jgi:hypothetical protein